MGTSDSKDLKQAGSRTAEEQISDLFGSFKAEWLREKLYDLFKEPKYFPELLTGRPCVLVGGRGTGKTSVLRFLSYEGQFARSGRNPSAVRDARFFGFYYRVDTNRVTAFRGPEISDDQWVRHFAHYLNLLLCDLVLRFVDWYQLNTGDAISLPAVACEELATALNLETYTDRTSLMKSLRLARVRFEAYINNVADGDHPPLSLQGAPFEPLFEALAELDSFRGKNFFFLIDEYENFLDYQQQVVNTLIKHSGALYTFKIGVKELGWRRRTTLNENEQLISPADYVRIDVAEHLSASDFATFAQEVCNERITRLVPPRSAPDIRSMLPALSDEEEAERLGVRQSVDRIIRQAATELDAKDIETLRSVSPLMTYFLEFRRTSERVPFHSVFRDYLANEREWNVNLGNYKHALLFTMKRGKSGIRKYYAGWDTFVHMAAGNIRYLLELVVQGLIVHLRGGGDLNAPVSPEDQTRAAQAVGRKNLSELEGLSVHGAQLTKLVLGLGRIFQVLAADAVGHTPEVNQFHLAGVPGDSDDEARGIELLRAAVMHLALLRSPGNKLVDTADTREFDYLVHPVFCAFFEFSHRRKRKIQLTTRQLLGLVSDPRDTIREVLAANNRRLDEPLPEQALLFGSYYGAADSSSSDSEV
jgi:hypothetical protein